MSIWPLYLVINELPYHVLYKRENMILAGLWFGLSKPAANLFINVFRGGLDDLFRWVNFTLNDQSEIEVREIVMCGTCDIPAKSQFLNMKQFNGDYGC